MQARTCVIPPGRFSHIVHRPVFSVTNLREKENITVLGRDDDRREVLNLRNFPNDDVIEPAGVPIFEIANPFPFRGATFIKKDWADKHAGKPETIRLPPPPSCSMTAFLEKWCRDNAESAARDLPRPVLLALASSSTDPNDLVILTAMAVDLIRDRNGAITGVPFSHDQDGHLRPQIRDHELHEVLVNNPALPEELKVKLVLVPGIQGTSEIIGDFARGDSHVYEYLRRNSYIPWGHFAANMADDAGRYSTADLSGDDIHGLRHLYYQRTFVRLARDAEITVPRRRELSPDAIENLRQEITDRLRQGWRPRFNATLWGWNYGFDFTAGGYRLHASHQQIHHQFAMVPGKSDDNQTVPYSCGDLVADFCRLYRARHQRSFFADYLGAIRANRRLDGREDLDSSLVVHADDRVILFVPKAQTSQWELQITCLAPVGNVVEADKTTRDALDRALLMAQKIYHGLGAKMVTSIEFSKRIDDAADDQHLLYSLLPKLPESMGAFSEAELRFINGNYPEDFAAACRLAARDI